MKVLVSPLLLVAIAVAPLGADVLITEQVVAKAGGRDINTTRSIHVKRAQMRIDSVQAGESTSTLYDLREGVTILLNANKKRAELREIAARNAKLERDYPRARVTTTVKATQVTKEIAGATCAEHTYEIRVPMTKDGSLAFMLTGAACVATDAPGADDYAAYARAAVERGVVLGAASDNYILLAVARAQTELYRALADLGGIPYLVNMTMSVDGKGMLAGMVRKVVSGARTSTVTAISVAPLDETAFAVPAGWKRERK